MQKFARIAEISTEVTGVTFYVHPVYLTLVVRRGGVTAECMRLPTPCFKKNIHSYYWL